MDNVTIFDTSLRDGEQSPGFSMTSGQKLRVAAALESLGVDVIEAGFAAASEDDFRAVQRIAEQTRASTVCALARCVSGDIQAAAEALAPAASPRIHVFVATSPLHRVHKLKMSEAQVLEQAIRGVREARSMCSDVEFSAEDAIRTEPEYLAKVIEAAIDAGATTVNIPDTVGYALPNEIGELFAYLKRTVPNIDQAVLSAHCHNDLGMAVANSLAAVTAGARQIECTINGIGERAGNCSLEEVVMALETRRDALKLTTSIETRRLLPTSRLVAGVTGSIVPRNKAVVGDNAFAHESGIHQHGVIAHPETYEIIEPETVGRTASQLILGKHSGRHALKQRVADLGFSVDGAALDELFARFKRLAERKRYVTDADIEVLAAGAVSADSAAWQLKSLQVDSGLELASAAVALAHANGEERREAAIGDGPVDAALKAMQRALDLEVHLRGVIIRSVSEGEDAQGEAELRAVHDEHEYSGHAASTDIVEACAQAFLQILNRIDRRRRSTPRPEPIKEVVHG
ncbi:MAG: 2-isopropylmalate synthase [Candidatus Competibacterales bacterium]|nr:2-isopropylmalate synthase [Candidatus Competibacterales bacterium]